jgi:hypothetical protein
MDLHLQRAGAGAVVRADGGADLERLGHAGVRRWRGGPGCQGSGAGRNRRMGLDD